jgi:hypothetical protein
MGIDGGSMSHPALVGAWTLVSFVYQQENGIAIPSPWGQNPPGLLIYTEQGYMAANFMRANRQPFATDNMLAASADEKASIAETFVGYSGTYEVQDTRVIHHVQVASFPNWIGTDLVRLMEWEGDRLRLHVPPIPSKRGPLTQILTWQRVS